MVASSKGEIEPYEAPLWYRKITLGPPAAAAAPDSGLTSASLAWPAQPASSRAVASRATGCFMVLPFFPSGGSAFEADQRDVGGQAQDREDYDRGVHLGDEEGVLAVDDQGADAGLGADVLG